MSVRPKKCPQCVASNKGGTDRCSRPTCKYGPKCWQHTKIQDGLVVKKSTIKGAGEGLFAAKAFHKDEKVAQYTGEKLTAPQLAKRYGKGKGKGKLGPYVVHQGNAQYIDARVTNSGVARYSNDCHGTSKQCNAELVTECKWVKAKGKRRKCVPEKTFIEAKREIKPGSEILTNYKDEYWTPQ